MMRICLALITIPHLIFAQDIVFHDEPENLGPKINSKYSEVSPLISPGGKVLYFNRKNHPKNSGGTADEDEIWYSTLLPDNTWSEPGNIGGPLNNNGNNSVKSITPDENMMLLMNAYNYFDGSMSQGCSVSYRDERGWRFPKKQNIEKYENLNDYVAYYLSNDGNILLMSVEMKKGFGERDIYVCFRKGPDDWSRPLNLGAAVNTKENEGSIFLASDNATLYYSSEGIPGGYGSSDIWMTKRLDNTWTNWSKPVNMGSKVNSADWDSYFTIPASGEYAYFVSSRSGYGSADIFRIKLPSEAKPDPVVLVYGRVLDKKNQTPLQTDISYELLPSGEAAGTARSSPQTGEYKIVLPFGRQYGFMARADGFYAITENLDLTGLKEYQEIEKNLYLAPIEVNEVVRLNNIFFEFGKATLKEESFPELNRVVKLLSDNPSMEIEIAGHTDNVGSDEANQKLSQERAQAVVDYLASKGVKKSRLTAKGYGETVPVATNDTDEGKALNRRVEFRIVKK